MTAIWQRLRENYGYTGSYSAVRRFVRKLCGSASKAVIRVHTVPGEEMQVDFGSYRDNGGGGYESTPGYAGNPAFGGYGDPAYRGCFGNGTDECSCPGE